MFRRFTLSLVLMSVVVAASVPASARSRPDADRPREGLAYTSAAPRAPRGRLDTTLDDLVTTLETRGRSAAVRAARADRLDVSGDAVEVVVWARPTKRSLAQQAVEAAGGSVTGVTGEYVMANVPIAKLPGLSLSPAVRSVFSPPRPIADAVTSEGLPEINVAALSAATGDHPAYTGAGVRVGVLDEGFTGYQTLLGEELPPASKVHMWPGPLPPRPPKPDSDIYDSIHGTGVMEIIHDIAPDAEFYIAAVDDPVDIAEAVDWMLANNVDVINISMGWWGWARVDGTGPVNEPFDKAAAAGVTCVASAGNYRRKHWHGDFNPGPETDIRRFLHNWAPNLEENQFTTRSRGWVEAWLWWDDWAEASQDFNLQLVRWDGAQWVEVAQSRDLQSVTDRPVEWVGQTLDPGTYAWRIWKHSASRNDVDFDFFFIHGSSFRADDPKQAMTFSRSILQPADNRSPGVLSVAAIGRASSGFAQEDYSSEGPTIDGRLGVDVSAPSAVSTVMYGSSGFSGTSAAAPHIAGIAALMHQMDSSMASSEVAESILAQTVDLGTPGIDRIFGAGRVALKPLPGLSCATNRSTAGFQQPVTITGRLTAGPTVLRSLSNVSVWRKHDRERDWLRIGSAAWDSGFDAYVASVGLRENGQVQLRFSGNTQFAARRSAPVPVKVQALLSTPTVPRTIRRGKAFTVTGFLSPPHTGGTKVELYRYVSGRPKLYRTYTPKMTTVDENTARYTVSLVAPTAGTWMVRTKHADATHAATISGGRRFSVK